MHKVRQDREFEGTAITRVPFLKLNSKRILEGGSSQEPVINKRPRVLNPQVVIRNFEDSMYKSLTSKIRSIINKGGSKMHQNLTDLKSKSLRATTLPAGILTNAAETSGCAPSLFRERLDKDSPKRNFIAWRDFVDSNFDNIVRALTASTGEPSTSEEPSEHQTTTSSFEEYRTFSTSWNQLIRKDLPSDVKGAIHTALSHSLESVSNFTIEFSRIVWMMMTALTHSQFKSENNNLTLEPLEERFQISSILPENFQCKQGLMYSSASLPLNDLLKGEVFLKDFEQLFGVGHLSLIHSYYFGARGTQQSILDKYPVFKALFQALESLGITKGMYCKDGVPSSAEMSSAFSTYRTNIQNIWKAGTLCSKLLNHLLNVLLRVHLAPKRETKRAKLIKDATEKKRPSITGLKPLSRNDIHNMIRAETYKMKKYERKSALHSKWERKLKEHQDRITYLKYLKPARVRIF
jgi:hypothetical protein